MGTWNANIFGSDTSLDIKEEFFRRFNFGEEVQDIQKIMTLSYLKLNLSTDEITYLVGYTESSAFLRAFKKWTGLTLSEYKNRLINQKNKF